MQSSLIKDKARGYADRLLRADLNSGELSIEPIGSDLLRKYVGGTCLGARYLIAEVPAGAGWSDPENRIILASGPLGGTPMSGTGTFSAVFKGPMTNLSGAVQANGFLGAYLRMAGFDALILQGRAPRWSYLFIHEDGAELRDAQELLGLDTWEVGEALSDQLGLRLRTQLSVFGIGPAGENGVRFAALVGDQGHVAAHNGIGAVLGSKQIKAVAVARSRGKIPFHDPERLSELAEELFHVSTAFAGGILYEYGTGGLLGAIYKGGVLPVKNYTTNLLPEYERLTGQHLRTHFEDWPNPCWACRVSDVHRMEVTEGPYAGVVGEEPEYEGLAGMGSNIGVTDPGAVFMLSNLVDRLGMDVNESSWLVSWLMECCEKGIVTTDDLDGMHLRWGDAEAVARLLRMVAAGEGVGRQLAEGVMRAARSLGRGSEELGVYTLKGNTPRSHDHRGRWFEMLDTCLSNTGTIEASWGSPPRLPGKPILEDAFSPEQVARANALTGGWRQFEDSLGICRWCCLSPPLVVEAVNAATGWDVDLEEALTIGRRGINLLRVFCFRHGLDVSTEWPSARYCSTPTDGPAEGKGMQPHFADMRRTYWRYMGWDEQSGRPLEKTLRELGLQNVEEEGGS